MALGEGGGDSGADALGKKQYIVVLRPIYGGQLGLGLGVQGVKCLAQGGGAAAQAVLVVGVLQQKGVVVPGAGRQLTAASAFLVRPDKGYAGYIDWRSLGILWSLMIITKGYMNNGIFEKIIPLCV